MRLKQQFLPKVDMLSSGNLFQRATCSSTHNTTYRRLQDKYLTTSDCKSKIAHSWAKAHAANIHACVQHVEFRCRDVVHIQLKVTYATAEQATKRQLSGSCRHNEVGIIHSHWTPESKSLLFTVWYNKRAEQNCAAYEDSISYWYMVVCSLKPIRTVCQSPDC